MPPPFTVRSGANPGADAGSWDSAGNITIPGRITASNVPANGGTVASVTAGDGTITVAGSATNPTVALGTVPQSAITGLVAALAAKAPTAGPTFTGTVAADDVTANGFTVPRGLVRRIVRTSDSTASSNTTQATATGVLSLQVTNLVIGRMYLVGCPAIAASSQTGNSIVYTLTATTDNTTPTNLSPILLTAETELPTIGRVENGGALYVVFKATATTNLYVRLNFFARSATNVTATHGAADFPLELHILDIGGDPGTSGGNIL